MRRALSDALNALAPDMRAVVLTGSARAFSAGADIAKFGRPPIAPHLGEVIAAIERCDRPVVAAIAGVALGGGLELALGCHYRVAAAGARLGLPEVKLGLLPGAGGTQRLPRVLGPVAALQLIAAGNPVTVNYMKQRRQFGRAIGEFQALQHRAVDVYVMLEQARSMALYATMMAGEDNVVGRHWAVTAAKAQIGRSGRRLGQEAIQLHGGIGVTMDYSVGHYFKRMTMIEALFDDADTHLAQLAAGGGILA